MRKLGLLSFAACVAVSSMMAGTMQIDSDLKISGDAQVRGISVKGDTSKKMILLDYKRNFIKINKLLIQKLI